MRAVIDTGILVSALIHRQGTTGEVLYTLRYGRFTIIYTTDILVEIIDVFGRSIFRTKYHIEPGDIGTVINLVRLRGELVVPTQRVVICRNPKDDKYLEAALTGADCIVSGDADLLDLTPFQNIPILRPKEFLTKL